MSTQTVIQACAALYGIVPGAAGVAFVNDQIGAAPKPFATEDAMLNHYYEATFTVWAPKSTAEVAALIVANLGFTGDAAATETTRIAGEIDSVAMAQRGAKVKEIITAFEATTAGADFVAKKDALVAAVADPTYAGIADKGLGEIAFSSLNLDQIKLGTAESVSVTPLSASENSYVGTAGTDIFTAVASGLSSERTLGANATIAGGEGADVLRVTLKGANTPDAFSMSGVETVELVNDGVVGRAFSLKGTSGVEKISLDSTKGPISLTQLPNAGVDVTLINQAFGDLSIGFATAAAVTTGTSDTLGLALSGVGTTSSVLLKTAGVDSLVLTSGGDVANKLTIHSDSANIKTVSVSGNAGLTIARSTTGTVVEEIDGSAMSGPLTYDNSTLAGFKGFTGSGSGINTFTTTQTDSLLATVSGGAANDTFKVLTTSVSPLATITGGDGVDTLEITGGSTKSLALTLSGVETLKIGGITGTFNFDASNVSGLQGVTITSANAAIDLIGLSISDMTLAFEGANSNDKEVKVSNTGALTVDLSKGTATSAVTNNMDVTAGSATSLNVAVGDSVTYSGTVTASKATEAAISSVSGSSTGFATGSKVLINKAESFSIDSNAALVTEVDAPVATSATVTHAGSDAATLALKTPVLEALTVTSTKAAMDLTGTNFDFSLLQVLTVTGAKGAITLPALAKVSNLTLSGTGTDSLLVLPSIGTADGTAPDYPVTVTLTGFKGGLASVAGTEGTGPTIGSNAGVILDLTKTTGVLTAGVATSDDNDGNDAVVFGNINGGDGSVEVRADGAGVIGIGTITAGTSVTVQASTVGIGSSFGNVTAKTVNFSGPASTSLGTPTTPFEISSAASNAAFSVTVNGGASRDVIKVNGHASNTSLTVTGSLGLAESSAIPDVLEIIPGSPTASSLTISAAGVTGSAATSLVVINTTAINDVVTGSSLQDLILVDAAGNDTITGGAGNDIIEFSSTGLMKVVAGSGTGHETKYYLGDSAASNAAGSGNWKVVTDFNVGKDIIDISLIEPTAAPAIPASTDYGSSTKPALSTTDNAIQLIRGSYSEGVFTASATGTDALYVGHDDTASADTSYGVVLAGYGSTSATASNQSGGGDSAALVGFDGTTFALTTYTGLVGIVG